MRQGGQRGGRMRPSCGWLAVAALAALALGASGQDATVRDGRELREALEDPGVFLVAVAQDVALTAYNGWPRDEPLVLGRSVTLEGPAGGAAKVFMQDITIPGEGADFLTASMPVNISMSNLHVVGVPLGFAAPPGMWNVTFLLTDCFLELWGNGTGSQPQLSTIRDRERPQGLPSPEGQQTSPLTRGRCDEELEIFDCPNVFDYLFLVDVAFDWTATGTVAPAGQEALPPGVFSAVDTVVALVTVDTSVVNDAAGFVEAVSGDDRPDLRVVVIDDSLRITQEDAICSDEPIELATNTIFFGGMPSDPPVNLLDFNFAEGCLLVPDGVTVTLTNLLLNSTVLRTRSQGAWLALVPFFDRLRGSRTELENVVWNLVYEPSTPLSAEEALEVLRARSPADGEPEDQVAELRDEGYCSDDLIGSSSSCMASPLCSELSACPDGAVAIDSVSYRSRGVDYKILSSVFITREVGPSPIQSPEPPVTPDPAPNPDPIPSPDPPPSPDRPASPPGPAPSPVMAPAATGSPTEGQMPDGEPPRGVGVGGAVEMGVDDASGEETKRSSGAVVVAAVVVGTTIMVCVLVIFFGYRRYKRKQGQKVEVQEPKDTKEVGDVAKDAVEQPTITKFVAVDADKHKVVLDMETGEEGILDDDEEMSSSSEDFPEDVQSHQETAEKLFDNIVMGDLLGQGSYGRVFKGTWNGAIVAVKVFTHTVEDERLEASIEREIQFMTELRHPNVVQQFKAGTRHVTPKSPLKRPNSDIEASCQTSSSTGVHSETYESALQAIKSSRKASKETWMVMEYCDLGILSNAIKAGWFYTDDDRADLNMEWVVRCAQDIARGCQYLHENRTVHGDLKPHNILLATSAYDSRRWGAKLADFGVSRRMGAVSHIYTSTVGTMAYLSPEILRDGKLSEAADIYAYGMIMWQLVCGESVFKGQSAADVWRLIAVEKWRPTFPPDINPRYQQLAKRCWSEEAQERPSFNAIQRELGGILQSL